MLETRRLKIRLPAMGFPLALALVGCALDPYGISSGAGGSGGGGGPSEPPKELCLNAADDDGNGKIDCADDACTADYECAPLIPTGWSATQVLERASGSTDPAPECKSGTASVLHADPGDLGTCGPCTCMYMGAVCTVPGIECDYDNDDCSNLNEAVNASTGCQSFDNVPFGSNTSGSCKLTTPSKVESPGTCMGTESVMDKPPMWGRDIHLCPLPPSQGGGCDKTGGVCVSKPLGDFAAGKTCIEQKGKHDCPAGWDALTSAYEGADDQRACTPCACDTGTVTCMGGGYTLYTNPFCTSIDYKDTVTSFDTCEQTPGIFDHGGAFAIGSRGMPQDGKCGGVGAPTGSVLPSDEHTICCQK